MGHRPFLYGASQLTVNISQKMNEQELINIAKRRQQAYKARRDPATKQSNAMKMLSLHIEKGLTYAAIGQRFGVSRQRVHQMIKEVTK